ncbi:hypothetical protein FXN61_22515 [Lentzea sp. PSKA42]|uniref:SD-repeat containing protein B domain-containing protein n=1 Tax=Lentzea indica TaxID=2604800 RepID=A0ABX1FLK7_9PSEU|nr:hypothetical protein [Lentzea indica]NKE59428.1 hypothetical protein [Lentzea indica]
MRALLLAVLVVITCTPVAFAQEGALVTVFWDRDGNGVRGEGEPAYKRPEIAIRDDAGFDAVVRGGEDGTYRLPHAGRWQVSHDEDPFVTTTPTVVQSDGQDVVFGIRGASICGTVWLDANTDGKVDEAESRIAGHRIAVEHYQWADREATTAPDGTYCLQDLPSGALTLQSGDRGGIDGTAWGYTAPDNPIIKTSSKFDWTSGRTRPVLIEPGAEITGYDSAFVQPKGMDVTARRVRIDNVRYDGVHVGIGSMSSANTR